MPDICSTCLSQNRTLKPLDLVKKEMTLAWLQVDFLCADSALCWECTEDLRRADRFRQRARDAQRAIQLQQPLTSMSTLVLTEICQDDYILSKTDEVLEKIKNNLNLTVIADKNKEKQIGEKRICQIDSVKVDEADMTPKNRMDEDQQCQTDEVSDTNSGNVKNPVKEDRNCQIDTVKLDNAETKQLQVQRHIDIIKVDDTDTSPIPSVKSHIEKMLKKLNQSMNRAPVKLFTIIEETEPVVPCQPMEKHGNPNTTKIKEPKILNVLQSKPQGIDTNPEFDITDPNFNIMEPIVEITESNYDTQPNYNTDEPKMEKTKPTHNLINQNVAATKQVVDKNNQTVEFTAAGDKMLTIGKSVYKKTQSAIVKTEPLVNEPDTTSDLTGSTVDTTEQNVNIIEPIVNITEPNINITKPAIPPETNVTVPTDHIEPNIDITEPAVNISEPNVTMSEPVVDITEPVVDTAEPKDQRTVNNYNNLSIEYEEVVYRNTQVSDGWPVLTVSGITNIIPTLKSESTATKHSKAVSIKANMNLNNNLRVTSSGSSKKVDPNLIHGIQILTKPRTLAAEQWIEATHVYADGERIAQEALRPLVNPKCRVNAPKLYKTGKTGSNVPSQNIQLYKISQPNVPESCKRKVVAATALQRVDDNSIALIPMDEGMVEKEPGLNRITDNLIQKDNILTKAVPHFRAIAPREDTARMIVQRKPGSIAKANIMQKCITEAEQHFPTRKDQDRMIVPSKPGSKESGNIIPKYSVLTEAVQKKGCPFILRKDRARLIAKCKPASNIKVLTDQHMQLEKTMNDDFRFVIPKGLSKVDVLRKAALDNDVDFVTLPKTMTKNLVQEIPNTSNADKKTANINHPIFYVESADLKELEPNKPIETVTQNKQSAKTGVVVVNVADNYSNRDTQELEESSDEIDNDEETTYEDVKPTLDSRIPVIDLQNSDSDPDSADENMPLINVAKQRNLIVKTVESAETNMPIMKTPTKIDESTEKVQSHEEDMPIIKVSVLKVDKVVQDATEVFSKETEIKLNDNETGASNSTTMAPKESTIQNKINVVGKIKPIPLSKLQPQAFDVNTYKSSIAINDQNDTAPTFMPKIGGVKTEITPLDNIQIESTVVDIVPKDLKLKYKAAQTDFKYDANVEKSKYLKELIAYNVSRVRDNASRPVYIIEDDKTEGTEDTGRPIFIIHDDKIEKIEAAERDLDIEKSIRKRKTSKAEEKESSLKRKKDIEKNKEERRKSDETGETSKLTEADEEQAIPENFDRLRSSNKNKTNILENKDCDTQNDGEICKEIFAYNPDKFTAINTVKTDKSETEVIKHSPRKKNKRKINTTDTESAVKTETIHEKSSTKRETRSKNLAELKILESPSKNKNSRKVKVENLSIECATADTAEVDIIVSETKKSRISESDASPKTDKRDLRSSTKIERPEKSKIDTKLSPNKKEKQNRDAMASNLPEKELVVNSSESPTKRKLRSKKSDHIQFKVESSTNDLKIKLVASTNSKETSLSSKTPKQINKSKKLEIENAPESQDSTREKASKTQENFKLKSKAKLERVTTSASQEPTSKTTSKTEDKLNLKLETAIASDTQESTSEKPSNSKKKQKSKSKKQPVTPYIVTYVTEEEMGRNRETQRKQETYLQFPFKCETCIQSFVSHDDYKTHVEDFHSEKSGPYLCSICTRRFQKEKTLIKHYKSHNVAYKCSKCGFKHHEEEAMVSHVKDMHELYKCQFCDSQFKQPSELSDHVLDTHMSSKALRKIPVRSNNPQNKQANISTMRYYMKNTSPKKRHDFVCDVCGQGANNRSSLKKHILLKHRCRIVIPQGVDDQLAIVYQ